MGYISRFTTVHKSWKLNSSRGSSMMDGRSYSSWHWSKLLRVGLLACAWTIPPCLTAANEKRQVPHHVPPKRSSQIQSGFGINSNLPREPYLPWERWWWTRPSSPRCCRSEEHTSELQSLAYLVCRL